MYLYVEGCTPIWYKYQGEQPGNPSLFYLVQETLVELGSTATLEAALSSTNNSRPASPAESLANSIAISELSLGSPGGGIIPYSPREERRRQREDQRVHGIIRQHTTTMERNIRGDLRTRNANILERIENLNNRINGFEQDIGHIGHTSEEGARDTRIATQSLYRVQGILERIDQCTYRMEQGQQALPNIMDIIREDLTHQRDILREVQEELRDGLREQGNQLDALTMMLQAVDQRVSTQGQEQSPTRTASPAISERTRGRPRTEDYIRRENRSFVGSPHRHSTVPRNIEPQSERRIEIPKDARMKRPDAFSGKRGQEAETFLSKMNMYFNDWVDTGAFTDHRKISTTLANLKEGDASRWAKPLINKINNQEPHEHLRNWASFQQAFLSHFGDPVTSGKLTSPL